MTVAAPTVPAYRPFLVQVARVNRLSPSFLRVTFTGPDLDECAPNGWDQRVKLLFPVPGRGLRDCPAGGDWLGAWRALPDDRRNPMRSYTVRAARPDVRELDVDFVLHGPTGPASAWAETAAAGAEVVLVGPNARFPGPTGGFEWRPPAGAAHLLLAGDETAVPAICAIVESLPPGRPATVLLEVPTAADILPLAVPAGVRLTCLPRWTSDVAVPTMRGLLLTRAVAAAARELAGPAPAADATALEDVDIDGGILWEVPEETVSARGPRLYSWLAGEAGMVKDLRRLLVRDAGLDRRAVAFMGYWRAGRGGD